MLGSAEFVLNFRASFLFGPKKAVKKELQF